MIRVLQLPDSIEKRNGRMSVIMNIYRKIDTSHIQFDFLCTDYGFENFQEEIHDLGGNVYMLPKSDATITNMRKLVNRILSRNDYNYIHYHAVSKWGCALSIAHRKGIKTIVHSHATKLSDSLFKEIRNRIYSLNILTCSDKRVAVSPEAGKKLFLWQNFKYIPNMIDYHKFSFDFVNRKKIRERYQISPNEILIGNVGRISKTKNQSFAIMVLNRLIKQNRNYRLMILGDSDDKEKDQLDRVKRLIMKYRLQDKVIFTGLVSDVEKYYSAFDYFWLPSLFEGQPTVGVEAQANGLNLLVSNKISRSLNATNNVIYEGISNSDIDKWVNITLQNGKRRNNGSVAKLEHSNFNSKQIIQEWLDLYSN